MDLLYSLFFGAGVAGFAYTKLGRRAGYGNTQSVWTITIVSFIIAAIFFYTLMDYILGIH